MEGLAVLVLIIWVGVPIMSCLLLVWVGITLIKGFFEMGTDKVKTRRQRQPRHQRYLTITAKKDVLSFDIPTTKRQIKKLVQDNSLEIVIQGKGIHTDLYFGGSYETIETIERFVATGQLAEAIKVW